MSLFSETIKQAAKRFPGGRHAGKYQAFGQARFPPPDNMQRHARRPRPVRGRTSAPANLADILTKKWGGPVAHASGRPFDAVAGRIIPGGSGAAQAALRANALRWLGDKAVPAILTGTLGAGAAVVGKEYVAPWITKKLSPKRSLVQQILRSPVARKLLLAGGGAVALGGGIALGESLYSRASSEVGKRRAFKKLVQHSPELVKQDPKHTVELFNALYTFNPDLAKNPLTASSFIKTRRHYKEEGLQPTDVKTLAEIGSLRSKARGKDSFLARTFGQSANLAGMAGLGVGA